MAIIVNGKSIATAILEQATAAVQARNMAPSLAVVWVGDDPASASFIRKKQQACQQVGVDFSLHQYPTDITMADLTTAVQQLQTQQQPTGVIVQLPLPAQLPVDEVLALVDPARDVDCLHPDNVALLSTDQPRFLPPAVAAILEVLQRHEIDLIDKKIALVGLGRLIGQPLQQVLLQRGYTVTAADVTTPDLAAVTSQADVVVTAVGKANLITAEMIKDGAVVIDAGCDFIDGKLVGDTDFAAVADKASLVTPTPGGIGLITVAKLIENVVQA